MLQPPLAKLASVRLSLFLFLLVIVFNVFIMPSLAGDQKAVPLDLQFAYSPERAYELIRSYSEETRSRYMIGEMTIDVAYPIVYTLFMSITLLLLFPNRTKLAWIPYTILVADLFENSGIATLLYNYPKELHTLALVTSVFSTVKWILVAIVTLLILGGLLNVLFSKNQKKQDA